MHALTGFKDELNDDILSSLFNDDYRLDGISNVQAMRAQAALSRAYNGIARRYTGID